jgi:hypothetical protein
MNADAVQAEINYGISISRQSIFIKTMMIINYTYESMILKKLFAENYNLKESAVHLIQDSSTVWLHFVKISPSLDFIALDNDAFFDAIFRENALFIKLK